MDIIKLLFLISFTMVWVIDAPKVGIAVFFTVVFGVVWACVAMLKYLNGP